MKKLILARHAKSSWDNPDITDFERPLNERGHRDAAHLAAVVSKLIEKPDIIYSSPAMRAATTCKYFAQAFAIPETEIRFEKNIYNGDMRYLAKFISNLPDKFNTVMIFGHNPDITSLYSYFSGDYIDNIPTCGVFAIEFDIEKWAAVQDENGRVLFLETPKKHFRQDSALAD